jgi:hypothetical protein
MGGLMFNEWLDSAPIALVAAVALAFMAAAAAAGFALRARREARGAGAGAENGEEGYFVSAVLGLLALLLGFTFSMAIDRYDARRLRVLDEANAIGTTYLRAQLLQEPHRTRISSLLLDYTENRVALAHASPDEAGRRLLARNDQLITDLWSATVPAFDSIRNIDFSSAFLDSMNNVIDLDAARKAARRARVPSEVLWVLFFYFVVTAGVLGYVLSGNRGRMTAGFMLLLLALSLALVIDIDRPTSGGIIESQAPMEDLLNTLEQQPPGSFDRWRTPAHNGDSTG